MTVSAQKTVSNIKNMQISVNLSELEEIFMNINFKNFNCMVKINSEEMVVAITTIVLLGRHTTGPLKNKMAIVTHFFDKNKLYEEIEKLYNKCLSISIKETYTRSEKKLVNTLFGLFTVTRAYAEDVSFFEQNFRLLYLLSY